MVFENSRSVDDAANGRPAFLLIPGEIAIDSSAVAYVQVRQMDRGARAFELPPRRDLGYLGMVRAECAPLGSVRQRRPAHEQEPGGTVPHHPARNDQTQTSEPACDQIGTVPAQHN